MAAISRMLGTPPEALRRTFRDRNDPHLSLRRAIAAASLLGIGSMAITSLLQLGLVRHLPDPPLGNFHSDKVNTSDEAYSYGGPDSPVTILAHAANLVVAATGDADRARRQPWLALLAALMAGAQSAIAANYLFYQMPRVDKAWCPYCILDALTHFATLVLALPEAKAALAKTSSAKGAVVSPRAQSN